MSKGNIVINPIAYIVLLIGLCYALLPHSVHVQYKFDFGFSHIIHVIGGIILSVIAVVILAYKKPEAIK